MTQSSEHVTVVPPDLYDEMMADDSDPAPDEDLRAAAERARGLISKS
jgi:hypothetical protein